MIYSYLSADMVARNHQPALSIRELEYFELDASEAYVADSGCRWFQVADEQDRAFRVGLWSSRKSIDCNCLAYRGQERLCAHMASVLVQVGLFQPSAPTQPDQQPAKANSWYEKDPDKFLSGLSPELRGRLSALREAYHDDDIFKWYVGF